MSEFYAPRLWPDLREWYDAELAKLSAAEKAQLASLLMDQARVPIGRAEAMLLELAELPRHYRLELASRLMADAVASTEGERPSLTSEGRRLWPLLGGVGLRIGRETKDACGSILNTERDVFSNDLTIMLATCSGLEALGRQIGHRVVAIRVTTDSEHELSLMNEGRYGARYDAEDSDFFDSVGAEQPGYDDWRIVPLDPTAGSALMVPTGLLPVRAEAVGFKVRLTGLDHLDFREMLKVLLRRSRLSHWKKRGGGLEHCFRVGADRESMVRATLDAQGELHRADDIVLLDAHDGEARLGRVVEDMLIRVALDLD